MVIIPGSDSNVFLLLFVGYLKTFSVSDDRTNLRRFGKKRSLSNGGNIQTFAKRG
jgi:hypothetical protein